MKKSLSVLSVLLVLLLLVGSLPMTAMAAQEDMTAVAADTVISVARIGGGSAPAAGNTPSYSWGVHTFDEKKFSIKANAWYNLTDGTQLQRTSTFVNTKTYALYLELEAKDGYVFDDAANIDTGFWSLINATTHVVYNLDKTHKTIEIYFTFRMSGDTGSCIVQLLPNGGFGSKRPVVITKGNAYTLPSNPFTAPTGGYFKKWDAGEVGSFFNVNKDTNITALWNTVLVDTVGVTGIASPAWTTSPDYVASIVGSGYQVNTAYDDGTYIVNGIEWRKFDGTRIPYNAGFSNSDYRYYVTVYLKANTLRWFNDISKMTATVNGWNANVEKDDRADDPDSGKYVKITYGYLSLLSSMWIKADAPAAFKKPSYTPNVDNNYSAKLNTKKNTDGYTNGVYWLDLNTRKIMDPDDLFLPGHAYRVVIDIIPANNYEFPVDSQLHTFLPSVKVNGVAVKKVDGGYGDYVNKGIRGELEAWVGYDFPEVVDNTTKISQANAAVTDPKTGEHPVFTGTVGEKGYKIKSVEWINVATGGSLTSSAAFEAGKEYTVKVTLTAEEGFLFNNNVYATINQKGTNYDVSEDRSELVMYYTYPPCESSSGYIIGDADADGEVTILDATAIQRTLASLPTQSFDERAADADRDGEVTILDATAIQRYLAGFPNIYGIGTKAS